jgi:glycosyltransferase involved in cell wall biosynthesis
MVKISAIICTYNGEKFLSKTLDSLKQQSLDKNDYEIVVVDNNSTDATASITKSFMTDYPELNMQYALQVKAGLSYARNKGIEVAKGAVIVFIDDDAQANTDFLAAHLQVYTTYPNAAGSGGKVIADYYNGETPEWISTYIDGLISVIDLGDVVKQFQGKYPIGCNMGFKRSVVQEMGGFNTEITYRSDEKFVFLQLQKNKYDIYYTPNAIAYHHIPAQRLTYQAIVKVSQITGAGERQRLKNNFLKLMGKFLEYKVKLVISLVLALGFLLKGQVKKAKYVVLVRYYVLKGFLFYGK